MTIRTTTRTVTFNNPFRLTGLDETLPAGAYKVETDEELLESVSFPVYRRVLTLLHLHPRAGSAGLSPTLQIDPNELDAALKRDQASVQPSVNRKAGQIDVAHTTASQSGETTEQAIARGEDEGMVAYQR